MLSAIMMVEGVEDLLEVVDINRRKYSSGVEWGRSD
jgi:hypothetical protein